jgi:signal transduction histidine kinase
MDIQEEKLQRQSALQQMLIDLATNFINLPTNEIDGCIMQALKRTGQFMDAARTSINQFTEDYTHYTRLYEWSPRPNSRAFPTYSKTPDFDVVIPKFKRGEPIILENMASPNYQELEGFLQLHGVGANIALPLLNEKGLFGTISMSWDDPREIGPEIRDMLHLIGGMFLNILERKQNEEQIQRQNAFQQILIDLSTTFINLPVDEIDQGITLALQRIVEFMGAMRCSINEVTEDGSYFSVLYEWTSPHNRTNYPIKTGIPNTTSLITRLQVGESLSVKDIAELPASEESLGYLRNLRIKAFVAVPLLRDGNLFGFVSISWDRPRDIAPDIQDLLRLIGGMFLNTLERKQNEERIHNLNSELEQRVTDRTSELLHTNEQLRETEEQLRAILDALPIPVVVVNDQGILLYANPVTVSMFDIDITENADATSIFSVELTDRLKINELITTHQNVRDLEIRYHMPEATIRTALISIEWFQFAGQSSMLVSMVDITELKRTQEAEREHRNLTEALLDSAMALTSTLQLDEVVKHILHSVNLVVAHDVANLMVLDGDDALVLGSRDHIPDDLDYKLVSTRFNYKEDYVGQTMLQTHQPLIIGDINEEPRFKRISTGPVLRAYLGVPIIVGQELIGILSLGTRAADFFTETHAKYLRIFALQAGIAIQNARLYEQAKTIAALEERQKLARDLHDSVTQTLFSANSIAEALPQLVSVNLEKTQSYLHDLHQLTHGAMAQMRSLLVELRPEGLVQMELGILLNQLCDVFTGRTQIIVHKDIKRALFLNPDKQIAFYRIAQESLNNIIKHAQASDVDVVLQSIDNSIEMRIHDNGRGFDPEKVSSSDHFGIKIMKERAEQTHTQLMIHSQKNQGTEVILRSTLP